MNTWPPSGTPRFYEIPAFVRFSPWDFTTDIKYRSKSIQSFWNNNYSIFLPLPNVIGTMTSMKYSSALGAVTNAQQGIREQLDSQGLLPELFVKRTGGLRQPRFPGTVPAATRPAGTLENINENYLDMVDTTWLGMNRRKYIFNFLLICKSILESQEAQRISNLFNIWSLSTMDSDQFQPNEIPSGMNRSIHPPMWGISTTSLYGDDTERSTSAWIGEYPQLCVLNDVKTLKVGGEDLNSIQGMQLDNNDSIFLPLQYKIQLEFTEIEPVYQSKDTVETKSRSQFFKIL